VKSENAVAQKVRVWSHSQNRFGEWGTGSAVYSLDSVQPSGDVGQATTCGEFPYLHGWYSNGLSHLGREEAMVFGSDGIERRSIAGALHRLHDASVRDEVLRRVGDGFLKGGRTRQLFKHRRHGRREVVPQALGGLCKDRGQRFVELRMDPFRVWTHELLR
jgi:hypothetical protein